MRAEEEWENVPGPEKEKRFSLGEVFFRALVGIDEGALLPREGDLKPGPGKRGKG